eukprot:403357514
MQQLCTRFYNKIIPNQLTPQTTNFLKSDPHNAVQYLGEKRLYRINVKPATGLAIFERVYWLQVNKLWDVQTGGQLLKWNYELIKNPKRLNVERIFRVDDAFYLFERNENGTIIHKLSLLTFEITKIATLKIPYYFGASYVVIQGRFIMQAGGYVYKFTEKTLRSRSYNAKPEYTYDYNLEFQVFDCFTGKFLDSKRFGKMSKGRHGCGLIERKNKIYIVGGVYYSSKQKKVIQRDKVEILDFKNPTGQELQEIDLFSFQCPEIVSFSTCFNDDYVFMTGHYIVNSYKLPLDHNNPEIRTPKEFMFKLNIKEKESTILQSNNVQGEANNHNNNQGLQQNQLEKISITMNAQFDHQKSPNMPKLVAELQLNVSFQDILIAGRQIIATNDIGHLNVSYQPKIVNVQEEIQKYYYVPANNAVKNLNPMLFKKNEKSNQIQKSEQKHIDKKTKIIEENKDDKSSQIKDLKPQKTSNEPPQSKIKKNNLNNQKVLNVRQSNQLSQNQPRNLMQQNQNTNHTTNNLITSSQNQQQANINTRNIQSSALVNRRSATAVVNQIQRAQPIATAANPIRTANINIGLVNRSRPQTAVMQARGQSIIQQQSRQ